MQETTVAFAHLRFPATGLEGKDRDGMDFDGSSSSDGDVSKCNTPSATKAHKATNVPSLMPQYKTQP